LTEQDPATAALLDVDRLSVSFRLPDGWVRAVTDVSLALRPGQLLAVVGESGCGKSVLAHALLGLLPRNATVTGRAVLHAPTGRARDLLSMPQRVLSRVVRGRLIGLVPQSPVTALNPVRTGRVLLEETLRAHHQKRTAVRERAEELAAAVGLSGDGLDLYAHELSGGMAQRLVTALALAPDPPLVLADEPTTGLDRCLVETTVDLLRARCDAGGAVLLITHDLPAAERVADTVAVMYAGRLVEVAPAGQLFEAPRHPYTAGLLDARPDRAFRSVPGHPPRLTQLPDGCAYAARCAHADQDCVEQPGYGETATGVVACHHDLSEPGRLSEPFGAPR
jgi:peptide/nickel transport system ATP-binding protein